MVGPAVEAMHAVLSSIIAPPTHLHWGGSCKPLAIRPAAFCQLSRGTAPAELHNTVRPPHLLPDLQGELVAARQRIAQLEVSWMGRYLCCDQGCMRLATILSLFTPH